MASLSHKLRRTSAKIPKPPILVFPRHYAGTLGAVAYSTLQDSAIRRELFVNILNANVTKRDAKDFIASLRPSKSAVNKSAVTEIPTLQETDGPAKEKAPNDEQIHLALVCFKCPETVDDFTLDGFALTVSQLVKLGMRIIIVLDSNGLEDSAGESTINDIKTFRDLFTEQAERVCRTIERHNPEGGRSIPSAFEWIEPNLARNQSLDFSPIAVANPDQLLDPLKRGLVLIVPSMAYTAYGQLLAASSKDVMTGLTKGLALAKSTTTSVPPRSEVDRVIIIDPIGGVPSKDRGNGAHNIINLEQPFDGFEQELSEYNIATKAKPPCPTERIIYKQHWHNLDMIRKCLAILPPASSGLILTPAAAANSSLANPSGENTTGRKIRQRNLLIHNLLTNKPIVSPSLPVARLACPDRDAGHLSRAALPTTTLVKRGVPLTIIPAELANGWQIPTNGTTAMKLEDDPRIDFPRLVHLINNSFRRNLDVPDYIARTTNRIAGVIVAGDYEGAAIFTWEMPQNTQDPARLVPYLDKFAVLQSSQGSNGVADILFQAMVETCFPNGVCWRSRKNNPVNKWYFERSAGSWRIPSSDWTMFWIGEILLAKNRWKDYVGVCTRVRQSWADGKKPT